MKTRSVNINYRALTLKAIDKHFSSLVVGMFTSVVLSFFVITVLGRSYLFSHLFPRKAATQLKTQHTRQYVVQEGDDLWKIAENAYGSGFNASDIAQYNKLTDPNGIYAGQIIILPLLTPKAATAGQITDTAAATGKVTFTGNTYTVKEGESLSDIAEQTYGDGSLWMRIANANHIVNPDVVPAGTVLTIPR